MAYGQSTFKLKEVQIKSVADPVHFKPDPYIGPVSEKTDSDPSKIKISDDFLKIVFSCFSFLLKRRIDKKKSLKKI